MRIYICVMKLMVCVCKKNIILENNRLFRKPPLLGPPSSLPDMRNLLGSGVHTFWGRKYLCTRIWDTSTNTEDCLLLASDQMHLIESIPCQSGCYICERKYTQSPY